MTDTEDLPTPPLPEETAITLARAGTVVLGARWVAFQRALAIRAAFCAGSMALVTTSTALTPVTAPARAVTSALI